MSTITNESEEMYLETIYRLALTQGKVRSVDIANELGYTKASVSVGMKSLLYKDYIKFNSDKTIELTECGKKRALGVYERHVVLKRILMKLGANADLAEAEGCKIEHVISKELLDVLESYLRKN